MHRDLDSKDAGWRHERAPPIWKSHCNFMKSHANSALRAAVMASVRAGQGFQRCE